MSYPDGQYYRKNNFDYKENRDLVAQRIFEELEFGIVKESTLREFNEIIQKMNGNGTTEYCDEVEICAGWKTIFVWMWAKAFYSHRQKKWIRLLKK